MAELIAYPNDAASMTARFALKHATAQAHERLDARFSRFDLTDRNDYGAFLLAQAGAFLPTEAALDDAGAGTVIGDWSDRRRASALRADLAALGLDEPPPVRIPAIEGEVAILGAAYVLEGSRLGGAMLLRQMPDDLPRAFMSAGNPKLWRAFVTHLDHRLSSPNDIAAASAVASSVFEAFASSASVLETPGRD